MMSDDGTKSALALQADYHTFLATKRPRAEASGIDIPLAAISQALYPFQRALVRWALRQGRAGIFAYTGLGKGLMAIEWTQHLDGRVLILAPLAVTHQLVREAREKLGVTIQYVRHPDEMTAQSPILWISTRTGGLVVRGYLINSLESGPIPGVRT